MVVIEVTSNQEMEAFIKDDSMPTLVDCYASWCGPCKQLAPKLEELSKEFDTKLRVVKVDVDEVDLDEGHEALKDVAALPTLFLVRGDKLVAKNVGADFDAIRMMVSKNI